MEKKQEEEDGVPEFYLIHHQISKKHNAGMVIRSACAFNVKEILVVGRPKTLMTFGSHGTEHYVHMRYFDDLKQIKEFCTALKIMICGVEIRSDAKSISEPEKCFKGSTAFLMGNEGQGILPIHAEICDFFVYIPHFGNGTASLNVSVAFSIVAHRFATWANYQERPRQGEKYVIDKSKAIVSQGKQSKGEVLDESELQKRQERMSKKSISEQVDYLGSFIQDNDDGDFQEENN